MSQKDIESHQVMKKDHSDSDDSSDVYWKDQQGNIREDVDDAMVFAVTETEELTPEISKRLLRKVDLFLLPAFCLLYATQYIDKLANSYGALLYLKKDLHMHDQQFAWTSTAFSIGMLSFEFPAAILLQKFPIAKTVSFFIILWGILICIHAAVKNYASYIALRVIAGMMEAAVTPSVTLLTSQWYRKDEQFLRVAIWFSFHGVGIIVGDAIAYGLAVHEKSYGIHPWRILFLITGLMTMLVGFVILFHIPDNPTKAWFLDEREKRLIVERIRDNHQGFGNHTFKFYQFKEAMLDHKTWLYFLFPVANLIPNSGIGQFGTTLLTKGMGYTRTNALLLQMISGGVEIVGCILIAYSSKFVKSRILLTSITISVALVFVCFLAFSNNHALALAGFSMTTLLPLGLICMLSLVASNVTGYTKKVTVSAMFLIGHSLGYIIGPQTFVAKQAPQYHGAKITIVTCTGASLVILALTFLSYHFENKKRDNLKSENPDYDLQGENFEFADLTDKENLSFRYAI